SDLTSRRTGLQLGLAAVTEANTGDIAVKLKPKHEHSSEEVIADLRVKIKQQEPTLDVEFPQLLQDMIGDLTSAPEPVVIKLFAHFFFSSRRQHTSSYGDWSSDVCSSDLGKRADFFLVADDPTRNISAVRRIRMVLEDGVVYYPQELYQALGIRPFASPPRVVAALAPAAESGRASCRERGPSGEVDAVGCE